jgi:DNA-binding LacI/PurR family transcriptional regulator
MDLRHVTAIPILMNCIQRVILERGLILEVVYADSLADLSGRVSSDYCDGVLVFHRGKCSEVFEKQICELLKNIPAVWCFRSHFDLQNEKDHVFYDNSSIGKIAANYLYKRGHSHVAICNIMEGRHEAFTERTETFISEAERLGMKVTPIAMLAQDKLTPAENNLLMADLFLSKYTPDISGAFFCADDLILSLECALASKGHSLHKLDLIGCNNDWTVMRYLCNNPATIDIKMEEIGVEAVKQLLLRINGDDAPVKEILLKPKLISAPPRN